MHLPKITLFAFASFWTGLPVALPGDAPPEPVVQAAELLRAARGVSPEICALAASSIGNGWGRQRPPYAAVAWEAAARSELREGVAEADLPAPRRALRCGPVHPRGGGAAHRPAAVAGRSLGPNPWPWPWPQPRPFP